ncbi:hypothetical protein DPMN_064591 [Dreissena polymorpha]|uniref:Uncharacterized protein n=1 Tax=Dreissena polymorpha TaxID=45954 RepID=A0A9D4CCG9_DREPO|nr:hypothetical protein DPMN_064591 [Dreissena polymorpha]
MEMNNLIHCAVTAVKFLVTGMDRSVFPSNDFDSPPSIVSSNGLKWTPSVLNRNVYATVHSCSSARPRIVTPVTS